MLHHVKKVVTKEVMKFYDNGPPKKMPSRLLYIPKRTYHKLYGSETWEWGGKLLKEFTIPLDYINLPSNDINPLPSTHAKFIDKSSYYEMMSNVYLYIGYVSHVFMNHAKKFMGNKFDEILLEFKKFSKNQNIFTFKIPRASIPSWNSSFVGTLAKNLKYYNNINLSTATKLKVSSSNAQFFTDKALTPEILENIYFISNTEIIELEKYYTSILYYNCVYQMIIEGCNDYNKRNT